MQQKRGVFGCEAVDAYREKLNRISMKLRYSRNCYLPSPQTFKREGPTCLNRQNVRIKLGKIPLLQSQLSHSKHKKPKLLNRQSKTPTLPSLPSKLPSLNRKLSNPAKLVIMENEINRQRYKSQNSEYFQNLIQLCKQRQSLTKQAAGSRVLTEVGSSMRLKNQELLKRCPSNFKKDITNLKCQLKYKKKQVHQNKSKKETTLLEKYHLTPWVNDQPDIDYQ